MPLAIARKPLSGTIINRLKTVELGLEGRNQAFVFEKCQFKRRKKSNVIKLCTL